MNPNKHEIIQQKQLMSTLHASSIIILIISQIMNSASSLNAFIEEVDVSGWMVWTIEYSGVWWCVNDTVLIP